MAVRGFSKQPLPFILNFYLLITAVAIIAMGLQLINYTKHSIPEALRSYGPIFRRGYKTYTLYLHVQESLPPGGLIYDEDYASCNWTEILSAPSLIRWEIIKFSLIFEANETVDLEFTSYNPQGSVTFHMMFTLSPGASKEWSADIDSFGTYKFEIKEHATQAVPINLRACVEHLVFERKYFNYGVFGVATTYPALALISYILNKFLFKNLKTEVFFIILAEG
jgi:hypothetical protein